MAGSVTSSRPIATRRRSPPDTRAPPPPPPPPPPPLMPTPLEEVEASPPPPPPTRECATLVSLRVASVASTRPSITLRGVAGGRRRRAE